MKNNQIEIFKSKIFGNIRTIMIDGEPWFVGKDVAKALGYSNSRDAIAKHVDPEDKGVSKCDTLGGAQELAIINESGLYALIFGSKLKSAKAFKRWVTSEVLPSIRKHGAYMLPEVLQKFIDDEEFHEHLILSMKDYTVQKYLITKSTVANDEAYKEWRNSTVTPMLYKLQTFYPTKTTLQILCDTYKDLNFYDDIDTKLVYNNFLNNQRKIAVDYNIENFEDDIKVPILYALYLDEASRFAIVKSLSNALQREYGKSSSQEVI